jgi:polar amino acid transport system substrate-binding protein
VTTAEKVDVVEDGTVDLTASAVSMTCDRWQRVSFSTAYYQTAQQAMVRDDAPIAVINDLAGRRVCVTRDSTSGGVITDAVPSVVLVPVETRTDCLVELQDGDADAIFTHRTFLLGFAQQDPHTRIIPDELSQQFYGIAVAHEHEDLVRFVNGVLDRMRRDGSLAALAAVWLGAANTTPIPEPNYRD